MGCGLRAPKDQAVNLWNGSYSLLPFIRAGFHPAQQAIHIHVVNVLALCLQRLLQGRIAPHRPVFDQKHRQALILLQRRQHLWV